MVCLEDQPIETMSDILDKEKKITHKALSNKVGDKLDDEKFFRAIKGLGKFDSMQLDWRSWPASRMTTTYTSRVSSSPRSVCAIRLTPL
jgi:nucleosome binding factor SPN SPT16 subunit